MASPGNNMEVDNWTHGEIIVTITELCAVIRDGKANAAMAAENFKLAKEKHERLAEEKKTVEEKLKRINMESEKADDEMRKAKDEETRLEAEGERTKTEITALAEQLLGITDPQIIASWLDGGELPGLSSAHEQAAPGAPVEDEPELQDEDEPEDEEDGESDSNDEALELVASLQEETEAYDLVGQVMLPRGYVSIQYESHDDIQDALEALKTRDDGRPPSATTIREIHRWTCRLGNYSHYMTPFWLAIRLSNIWELGSQTYGGEVVSHDNAAIPEGHREAISHIAKELERVRTRTAWEHITYADLCYRA
jgi:hypothetical protein